MKKSTTRVALIVAIAIAMPSRGGSCGRVQTVRHREDEQQDPDRMSSGQSHGRDAGVAELVMLAGCVGARVVGEIEAQTR